MKEKNITINLSEYKELLLKERPNDNDKWVLGKIKEFISNNSKLNDDCNKIEIKDEWHFADKFLEFLKIIDMEFYKSIVKKCYDNKMEEEENKLKVEKMNAIKELNKNKKE